MRLPSPRRRRSRTLLHSARSRSAAARAEDPRSLLDEAAEEPRARAAAELSQRGGLDLADALARHAHAGADLFEGALGVVADAEAELQDLRLARRERVEDAVDLTAE